MLKNLWQIICTIGKRFVTDRFTYSAAALTYATLLSIVPLMAVGLAIFSVFPIFHSFNADIEQFIFTNFVPASGDVIQKYLTGFVSQTGKLSLIGMTILVITAVLMLLMIERTLNDVWKIEHRRKGVSAILLYWAILSLAPLFVGLGLAATSYVISLPFIAGTAETLGIKSFVIGGVPFLLTVISFTLLYVVVPNCRVPFRHGFIAALIAAILFQLAKKAFLFYVTSFKTYELLYGALATIPIFLIWIYVSWVIVLFGALISNVLATHYYARQGGRVDPFRQAFLWLGLLWKAQQQGKGLTISQLCHALPGLYDVEPRDQMQVLLKKKIVTVTNDNQYFLARDFSHMTLAALYQALPWKLSTGTLDEGGLEALLIKVHGRIDEALDVTLADVYEQLPEKL